MSLYFWIIVISFIGPFLLSFDKRVAFYKKWRYIFPAILPIALAFIVWDDYFTKNEIWGFTPEHLQGLYLLSLPVEEILFFFVIPYNCVFIYDVLLEYFPTVRPVKIAKIFAVYFVLSGLIFTTWFLDNWYTSVACSISAILTIGFYFIYKVSWFDRFAFTYLVAILPFLIVNGILTGIATENPVVWYNENHIMGFRIITIPFEDLYYNYALILPIIGLYEFFMKKYRHI
ncbi:MAG: lycopene cyclase domain-containing protein [Bacteroidota bacterium]